VDGLACPFCAYGLEKKLTPLPGVTAVRIDYQAGWVELTLGDGATLEEATIRRAVRAAGFTPRAIHRVAPGDGHDHGEEGR
jgi:mercuric ion binding protein